MAYFTLHLTSNDSSFAYSFIQEFLDKEYELGLLKLDSKLVIDSKTKLFESILLTGTYKFEFL